MNILRAGKKSARLCAATLMMSIILLPEGSAETIPVPEYKPIMTSSMTVPLPSKKPEYIEYKKESPIGYMRANTFKSNILSFASLSSTEKLVTSNGYHPLSSNQSKLYANIFEAQALGNMGKADGFLEQIKDKRLLGNVLYQRYMHISYNSNLIELKNWMELYPDHFGADKIYKIALSKLEVDNTTEIKKPRNGRLLSQINQPMIYYPKRHISKISRNFDQKKSVKALSRKVRALVRTGNPLEALKYFRNSKSREFMDKVEHDNIQSKIAAGFLYNRNFDSAYQLAAQSSDRSGSKVPNAAWIAGLSLWQQGKFSDAAKYFEKTGSSLYASGWLSSAGSFWAARSYSRAGNQEKLRISLENAAKHSRTFYGLMAMQLLGGDFGFNWEIPEYSSAHEELILEKNAGKRAFSLVAAGQYDLAEGELMRLNYKGNNALRRAVLAYASHVGLPGIALRLGNMVRNDNGKYYDSALYPLSPWSPEGGYKIDPALIHAIVRQESRFNLQATSYSGAVGLMQLMPKTAHYIAKIQNYRGGLNPHKLRLPEINMKLGQDYIQYLLKGRYVKGDMVSLLVAYNAGPGNLVKWRSRMGDNKDILLFIEMMPVKETRDYVEHVLSNYWIYRLRAGLDLPSLIAMSRGKASKYAHIMRSDYPYKLAAK